MAFSVVAVSLHDWRSSPKRKARPPVRDRQVGGTEPRPRGDGPSLGSGPLRRHLGATPSPTVESSRVLYGSPVSVSLLT